MSLKQAGNERGQTKWKIWLAGSNKSKFFLLNTGQKFKFLKNRVLQLEMGQKQKFQSKKKFRTWVKIGPKGKYFQNQS